MAAKKPRFGGSSWDENKNNSRRSRRCGIAINNGNFSAVMGWGTALYMFALLLIATTGD